MTLAETQLILYDVAYRDDRNRVVRMWRRVGLLCLQVAPGAF